jgi:hypothetical protein
MTDQRSGGIDDPNLRQGIDDPELRSGVDDPDIRQGIDDPELRTGIDDPDIRQGIDDPNIRQGIDNPEIQPIQAPTVSGMSLTTPRLLGIGAIGAVVVAVGAIVIFNPFGAPGSSAGPGTTAGPGATKGAGGTPAAAGASLGAAKDGTANLVVSGGYEGSWTLDSNSADVSPTATIIAGVWVKTIDNVPAGYGDLITLTVSGPIGTGTVSTSQAGVVLSFTITRSDTKGVDLFSHQFVSKAGECQVSMARGATGVTGTFNCASLTSDTGKTVKASGSFAT